MTAPAANSFPPTETRLTLLANGYWPLPIGKGKRPPMQLKGWSSIRANPATIASWERGYRDCQSTGILTGDLVAIDIDAPVPATAEKLIARLMAIPGAASAPCRTGRAPKCLFVFRASEPRTKRSTAFYVVEGQDCQVEVLGTGQQFVAYGIHDTTGKPYTWSGGDPLTVPLAGLPVIDVAAIDAYLVDATTILAAAGTPKKATPARQSKQAGDSFWQRVNTAALEQTDAWVPALFNGARKEAGTGAWRVSSKELGRPLEEDISIHPDGIQDFGREQPETAINLVMEYGGASNTREAAFWLCQQMGIEPQTLGWEQRQPVAMRFGTAATTLVAANDDDPSDDMPGEPVAVTALPEALCYPPGAVGDFTRFIASCGRFPSPHLALVSALALTAGLIGRRYKGPTGLRSNLYIVGLAESGFGKDITIRAAEALADSTGDGSKVSRHIFADKLRSLPGLANRLKKSPSCISVIDEFGKFLALHTGRNVAPHREEITTALMELTGAPQGSWGGQEKAGGNIPRIVQPCLTIHGISTPSTFWGALSSGNIDEGLLGRLVVIDAGDAEPRKVRRPAGDLDNVPGEIAERVSGLLGGSAGRFGHGAFHALSANAEERPYPMITATFAPGVEDVFEGFDDRMRAMRGNLDPQFRPILNRVGENAGRLALIVAVGIDPQEPVITREVQQWANDVAEASFYTIICGARENIADNERSAEYLRVRNMIVRAEEDGITRGVVDRRLRGAIDKRRLDDIFTTLQTAGEVKFGKLVTESGQNRIRYWATQHCPDGVQPPPFTE